MTLRVLGPGLGRAGTYSLKLALERLFPDALVVLSTRPAEDWYRSAASTIFQVDTESSPFTGLYRERFGFGDRFDDAESMIAAYQRHNASVRSAVPPDRFLEWTVGDGWEPLCARLGLPVPDEESPGPTPLRSSGPTTASADW